MKILANRKIKFLFFIVLLGSTLSALVSTVCVCLNGRNAVLWVLLSSASAGIAVLAALYLFFREQNKLMENAIAQIRDYTFIICSVLFQRKSAPALFDRFRQLRHRH